jgi:hypothetical protein
MTESYQCASIASRSSDHGIPALYRAISAWGGGVNISQSAGPA